MEMVHQSRVRTAYYFSCPDQEILDERMLSLSCDEDTWLYKMKDASFNGYSEQLFHHGSSLQNKHFSTATGGSVDSRTFTRRKHGSLRPSLDSLAESPLSNNRSSLGLLSTSTLLNNSMGEKHMLKAGNQEKTFSNSIVSEILPQNRAFKLDTPFVNTTALERNCQLPSKHAVYERLRFDSESSESSIIPSLENFSPFEKNDVMTDSLVVFLEKEVACHPPTEFQDDGCMSDSLLSLTVDQDPHSILHTNSKSELMTDSLVNFLGPINCKPPSGFEDNDMSNSVVKLKDSDDLPTCDMTNSVLDYLANVKPSGSPIDSTTISEFETALSETENIPPNNCDNNDNLNSNCLKPSNKTIQTSKLSSLYETEYDKVVRPSDTNEFHKTVNITFTKGDSNYDVEDSETAIPSYTNKCNEHENFTFTNSVNISRRSRANVANANEFTFQNNDSQKMNRTFTKSELLDTLNSSRQIPLRNSTFNTTFTKLKPPSKNSSFVKSTEGLNGGLEDDQTSSASDSSFSSGSTKPRSFDELQTIALRQEKSLGSQSTPTETIFAKLDIELSPIRGMSSIPGRSSESRSANCSPVRSTTQRYLHPHPISRLHQPSLVDTKRQLHTSSLLNIARPQVSGLRMPRPLSRTSALQKTETRPITAPPLAVTGIPRPQASRLPMPRLRGSGIPGPRKRGGFH